MKDSAELQRNHAKSESPTDLLVDTVSPPAADAPAGPARGPAKNIVVCCDGSWCGELTGTTTNIAILAKAFRDPELRLDRPDRMEPEEWSSTDTVVRYFEGCGVKGSMADYFANGALALDIDQRCVEAYEFIVQHYHSKAQVWMFGLSRGAYTVRSVAGMINNCGILKSDKFPSVQEPDKLNIKLRHACEEVYKIYRDTDKRYQPWSEFSIKFREDHSHNANRPHVRFMGLFDTVGALGVPDVSAGKHLEYYGPKLYDEIVSWEVQDVCQALALTDRMSPFTPCFVRREGDDGSPEVRLRYGYSRKEYKTEQVWFPGSHYDIGRQRFVLFRASNDMIENTLHSLTKHQNLLQTNTTYTESLSDPPFKWMVKEIKAADPNVLPGNAEEYLESFKKPPWEAPTSNGQSWACWLIGWCFYVFSLYLYGLLFYAPSLCVSTAETVLELLSERLPMILPVSDRLRTILKTVKGFLHDLKGLLTGQPHLTIDAYDEASKRLKLLKPLKYLLGPVGVLLDEQLLADRHIPHYTPPATPTFCARTEDDLSRFVADDKKVKLYKSETFLRWKSLSDGVYNRLDPDTLEMRVVSGTNAT